jgi:hypothetical protein
VNQRLAATEAKAREVGHAVGLHFQGMPEFVKFKVLPKERFKDPKDRSVGDVYYQFVDIDNDDKKELVYQWHHFKGGEKNNKMVYFRRYENENIPKKFMFEDLYNGGIVLDKYIEKNTAVPCDIDKLDSGAFLKCTGKYKFKLNIKSMMSRTDLFVELFHYKGSVYMFSHYRITGDTDGYLAYISRLRQADKVYRIVHHCLLHMKNRPHRVQE